MNTPFDKLNRLRKVAGKLPLKMWKASTESLDATIQRLENDGYEDPGPDPIDQKAAVDLPPDFIPEGVDFGPDAKADTPPTAEEIPSLSKDMGDLGKAVLPKEPAKAVTKAPRAALARGVGDDLMGANCRLAVRQQREAEKREKDALKPSKEQKKADKKAAKLKKKKDGTAEKTTTSGKKRKLGKELVEKIEKQSKAKSAGKQADPDNFSVAELARECDMDPKVARAKLRRHEDKIKKLHSKGQDRWDFPNAARKTLRDILCPDKK